MTTLATVLSDTTYLVESTPIPGQWDREAYLEAINWAVMEAARLTRYTWALITNQLTSNNIITLAEAPIEILEVRFPAMAKTLLKSSEAIENSLDPGWRYKTGTPSSWFEEAGNRIRLNRKVSAQSSFDVEVLEVPTALAADEDTVDTRFPDYVVAALRHGAAFYLLTQAGDNKDQAKAQASLLLFKELVTGQKATA